MELIQFLRITKDIFMLCIFLHLHNNSIANRSKIYIEKKNKIQQKVILFFL